MTPETPHRLVRAIRAALGGEIADLREHGGMISAHWVAQHLEHIADYGHRAPRAGERMHIHHDTEVITNAAARGLGISTEEAL